MSARNKEFRDHLCYDQKHFVGHIFGSQFFDINHIEFLEEEVIAPPLKKRRIE